MEPHRSSWEEGGSILVTYAWGRVSSTPTQGQAPADLLVLVRTRATR